MRAADVVVIGAGVIGAAIAYELSRSTRLRVVVFERGVPGCEASSAAAGVLAVSSGHARRGVLLDLRRRGAAMFPAVVERLERETGIDTAYRQPGLLSLAYAAAEAQELQDLVGHRNGQGLRAEWLDREAVLAVEPAVSRECIGGALFPDEAVIASDRFVAALVTAARQGGVAFITDCAVDSVKNGGGAVRITSAREEVDTRTVVVAAGAWSGQVLAASGIKVPVRPARGEMGALPPPASGMRHVVRAGDGYLVPASGAEMLAGSTTAFVGFDKTVTPAGIAALRAHAERLVPALRDVPFVRTWAGLRPCPTIRRPIIGPLPGSSQILLATGHHRNGILLAPITATLIREMVTGEPPSVPLQPFSYRKH